MAFGYPKYVNACVNISIFGTGASCDEENWRAQYGQVIQSEQTPRPEFPVVDLWDWAMATGSRKNGKGEVVRLVGRLVRRSVKLHPSMASGGSRLKTAPICQVHLDLVQVTSGLHLSLQFSTEYTILLHKYSRSFHIGLHSFMHC